MERIKRIIKLYLQFFKFGCFTFGGGWGIIAQMRVAYIEKEPCISDEDILELTSIGRSLPGTMIGNIAMMFGYRQAGFGGGLACLLGMTTPPFLILMVITQFYTAFRSNYWVSAAMSGICTAVVPIMISGVLPMMKSVLKRRSGIVIALAALIACLFFNMGSVWVVVCGAVCGLLLNAFKAERGDAK